MPTDNAEQMFRAVQRVLNPVSRVSCSSRCRSTTVFVTSYRRCAHKSLARCPRTLTAASATDADTAAVSAVSSNSRSASLIRPVARLLMVHVNSLHANTSHTAVLETGPLPPQEHKSGAVCRSISNYVANSGGYWRHFYSDNEATAQCELFLTAPNRNILT